MVEKEADCSTYHCLRCGTNTHCSLCSGHGSVSCSAALVQNDSMICQEIWYAHSRSSEDEAQSIWWSSSFSSGTAIRSKFEFIYVQILAVVQPHRAASMAADSKKIGLKIGLLFIIELTVINAKSFVTEDAYSYLKILIQNTVRVHESFFM